MPALSLIDDSPTMPPLVMDTRDDTDDTDDAGPRVGPWKMSVTVTPTRSTMAILSLIVQSLLLALVGCLVAEVWVSVLAVYSMVD